MYLVKQGSNRRKSETVKPLITTLIVGIAIFSLPAKDLIIASPTRFDIEPSEPVAVIEAPEVETIEKIDKVVIEAPKPVSEAINSSGHSCEQYRHIFSKYDWNVNQMMAIAMAESSCNTNAKGDDRVIGGLHAPSCGLTQVRTLKGRPTCEALKDPATNIEWAYKIYKGQGLKAWSMFNNGMYKKYL